jgi:hypothetical protein
MPSAVFLLITKYRLPTPGYRLLPASLTIFSMANLTLVYGLRLLPSEEVSEVGDATLKLKNGREARVTMHMLEGSKDDIEKQLKTSLEAFFDFYPEI